MDKELYHNLKKIKDFDGDVRDLFLTFTVADSIDHNKEIEIIKGGKNISVTNENKFKYIYRLAFHKLNEEIKEQTKAFL